MVVSGVAEESVTPFCVVRAVRSAVSALSTRPR